MKTICQEKITLLKRRLQVWYYPRLGDSRFTTLGSRAHDSTTARPFSPQSPAVWEKKAKVLKMESKTGSKSPFLVVGTIKSDDLRPSRAQVPELAHLQGLLVQLEKTRLEMSFSRQAYPKDRQSYEHAAAVLSQDDVLQDLRQGVWCCIRRNQGARHQQLPHVQPVLHTRDQRQRSRYRCTARPIDTGITRRWQSAFLWNCRRRSIHDGMHKRQRISS